MGRSEREKGKRGERATAKEIAERFGVDAHRGWQARDGADAPDVVGLRVNAPESARSLRTMGAT